MMSQYVVSEQADTVQTFQEQTLNITLLASEWKSSAGGLSTLNRELAIHLSQIQHVKVSILVPEGACNNEDKMEAGRFGISILDAKECVDVEPLLWLSNPPHGHKIDVIVGHGVKLGRPVQLLKGQAQFQNCKWVHVVHTAPEELSKHKDYSNPISRGGKKHQNEVDLCKKADLVVPVGPKLGEAYRAYLQSCKKDEDFFVLTPGLFYREFGVLNQRAKNEKDDFIVLLCGRGDEEDFELKGYDIAVAAFTDQQLKGKHYSLLFVGSAEGKQDEVSKRLLNCGIAAMDKKQLTVREFVKSRGEMKELFCEVDMVIMPSKSEGFGIVALEALSAGLPILVGRNSGFARAIESIPLGSYSIVDSEDPAKWAEAIQGVCDRHRVVLQENTILKEYYSREYSWKTQCKELVDRLWKMVYGTSAAQVVAADDVVTQCPTGVSESVCHPDRTSIQQHIEIGVVASGRRNEGTSPDELTLLELADRFIKLKIETASLNEGQKKYVYDMLMLQATTFMESRNYSKVKVPGMSAFLEVLEVFYNASLVVLNVGSLIISLDCKTLRGLDQLWNDYLCGHLNKVAERYLVTNEMKKKLNLRTIKLKTTLEEGDYLKCKKVLMVCSGEADSTTLSSQQGALDQGTGMIGMTTATDDQELLVKQENTNWMIRMEKARASRSSLHKASVNGQYEEVKKYLSSGCAVDVKDQESVVKLLLHYGADVNATDKFQFTPLHKAERRNHQSIVKLLLDLTARPTFQHPPSLRTLGRRAFTRTDGHSGFNLLQAAVLEGDVDTVRKASVLLESFLEEMTCRTTGEKASIFPGKSAADILSAVEGRKISPIGILYDVFGETGKTLKMYQKVFEVEIGLTELHSCAKRNDVEMAIELVLNYGIDVNFARETNVTPLVWASTAASSLSIKTLIDLGADVNAEAFVDSSFWGCGCTALYSAIHGNNAAVVKVLLANKADANIVDKQGNTALHSSTSKQFCYISQLLIDSGCTIHGRNNKGETTLHSAVLGNNITDVQLLLKNNADTNLQDNSGNTPFHISTLRRFSHISQLLIDAGCKINGSNNRGETPLYSAVLCNNVTDVQLLLKNNADANLQDKSGNTPLHISTLKGFSHISQLLIDAGCKINRINNRGETPLYSAIRGNNITDVQLLLKNNVVVNLQDISGNTPLHTAIFKGFSDISEMLIKSGCNVNLRNNSGATPLHCSVIEKNAAIVDLLLATYADANIQDLSGNTPLHLSVSKGFSEISQLLIDAACNTNLRNSRGETPLHFAVLENNTAVVKHLLKSKADANIQDQRGNTPLHISTLKGFSDISQLLIESGCNINLRNNRGESPSYVGPRPSPDTRS